MEQLKQLKCTVQFPIDGPIPLDTVKEMVRFRLKDNRSKDAKRGAKY